MTKKYVCKYITIYTFHVYSKRCETMNSHPVSVYGTGISRY